MTSRWKKIRRSILLLNAVVFLACATSAQAPRTRISLNDNWRFTTKTLADAEAATTKARNWQRVDLPHTWNDKDPFDDTPGYRRAPAWYQRTVEIPAGYGGRQIFLHFEGANQTARVFVNGHFAGEHIGGYTAFTFDVTDDVKVGQGNLIAIQVDNTRNLDRPPIDGDFNIYGGIYRDVWLITTDKVHVNMSDLGSSGVRVDTPKTTDERKVVRSTGLIYNHDTRRRTVDLVHEVIDARGRAVGSLTSERFPIAAGSSGRFSHAVNVYRPRLWSPDSPYLYTLRLTIKENGRAIDVVDQPLGFRWFRFDANAGFFLNGKPLKLRGTNRHQDRQGMGSAVPDRLQISDLETIKKDGFNFLRLAHYPQDPSVLDAADRLGLMLWEEIPIVNQIHVSNEFNSNARRMLTEMIRQHRNHPSVIIWGYMNETYLPVPKSDETVRATVALAKDLEAICKAEDPTRATAIAFDHGARDLYYTSGLGDVTDVVGWNLYHGWYYEKFEDFGKFLDDQHRRHPTRPLIVSEYGANGDPRVHSLTPKAFDSSIEWQRRFHESYLPEIESRPFVAGGAIWNQFDFGSEFRGETIPHVNQKGMYTFDRRPKDTAFYYKVHFSARPIVHIAVRDWPVRSGSRQQSVEVYSNLDEVELVHNGRSLGKRSQKDRKSSWQLELANGRNNLIARGRRGRSLVIDRAVTTYRDPSDTRDIAINCGSNVEYSDAAGAIWQAETSSAAKSWSVSTANSKLTENRGNIIGSADDQIFQTMREGPAEYRLKVPDGEYELELRFAEPKFRETSKRLFRVTVNRNSSPLIDLVREAGFMTQHVRRIKVRTRGGTGIDISLSAVVDQPVISAIRSRWIRA